MAGESLQFTVDSQLLGELGERLVTKNYIALSELIKNSYDADSPQVKIEFINAKKETDERSKIIIRDQGDGMTLQEVHDFWMRIATPNKVRNPVSSRYGRGKTGNKGIGRFACRRLAERLTIISRGYNEKKKEYEYTEVKFNWSDFEPGTDLTEVPCKVTTRKAKKEKTGVTLFLKDLQGYWTDRDFYTLRRQILMLTVSKGIRRKGYEEDPGFDIKLDAPEFPGGRGMLVEQLLEAGWGTLDGSVDRKGVVKLELRAKKIGKKSYELPKEFDNIGGVKFKLAWIPMKKEYYRDKKLLSKAGAKEIMGDFAGVMVYYNNFRVYPYGDLGDDWLDLNKDIAVRKGTVDSIFIKTSNALGVDSGRAFLNAPRNEALLGKILIESSISPEFEIKMDREGFIENLAYRELIKVIRLGIDWMTLHYNNFLYLYETERLKAAERELRETLKEVKEEKTRLKEDKVSGPVIRAAMGVISKETERQQELSKDKNKTNSKERIGAALKVIDRSFTKKEIQLNILMAVASTGQLMLNFSHEIKTLMGELDTHANSLERISETLPTEQSKEFVKFAKKLRKTRDNVDNQIKLFGIFSTIQEERDRKKVFLNKEITEILQGFTNLIEHYEIDVELDVPKTFRTGEIMKAELYSIVVNLVSNAIKAVLAEKGEKVLIKAFKENGKTKLLVFDDGIGVPEEYKEGIFEPLNVDPDGRLYKKLLERFKDEELAMLGRGSGIGLGIVKDIVENYNGSIRFTKVKKPWKTCVEVILP